jgi:pyridoxal phosphate enzyme (YggS family)
VGGGVTLDPDALRAALAEAREGLDEAARRAGRPPGSVELVLAGKYIPVDETAALLEAGVEVVGENRLQDLRARREAAGDRLTYDFIGHLQRKKAREVIGSVRLLHSLDSAPLAAAIAARAEGPTRVLVEVNVAGESTKGGIVPPQLRAFMEDVSEHTDLVVGGLMAMPPFQTDAELSRPHFAAVRRLAEELATEWRGRHDLSDLSMGTSQDYLVAAEEGATKVRVGRGILDKALITTSREA